MGRERGSRRFQPGPPAGGSAAVRGGRRRFPCVQRALSRERAGEGEPRADVRAGRAGGRSGADLCGSAGAARSRRDRLLQSRRRSVPRGAVGAGGQGVREGRRAQPLRPRRAVQPRPGAVRAGERPARGGRYGGGRDRICGARRDCRAAARDRSGRAAGVHAARAVAALARGARRRSGTA